MKQKRTRLLSLLLCCFLLVGLLPVIASAASSGGGEIKVYKVDENGQPLAGATFVLKVDKDGVAGEAAYEAVSDEEGLVTFTEVLPGSYILAESAAPAGYVKSDDTYSLYVNEDGRVILFTEEAPNGTEYTPVTIANQAKSANSGPVNTGDASLLPVLGTLLISGAASIVLLKLRKRWA